MIDSNIVNFIDYSTSLVLVYTQQARVQVGGRACPPLDNQGYPYI